MAHDEKDGGFKVVDRRAASGAPEDPAKAEPAKVDPAMKERPPLSFAIFLESLAHQALIGLGLAPWPGSDEMRVEAGLAKEMIDILIILQKKTAGNLEKDEEALINTMLYQLQMAYLEITSKPVK